MLNSFLQEVIRYNVKLFTKIFSAYDWQKKKKLYWAWLGKTIFLFKKSVQDNIRETWFVCRPSDDFHSQDKI